MENTSFEKVNELIVHRRYMLVGENLRKNRGDF
jgi:hypothetical protein